MPVPRNSESIGAIIVAAGSSRRMQGRDKLLAPLAGKPVLLRAIEPFVGHPGICETVLVLSTDNLRPATRILENAGIRELVSVRLGGARRQDSVYNGFSALEECDWVVVHDAARPLLTRDLIDRGLETARETGAAVAAVPVADTLKTAGSDMIVTGAPAREEFWQVQTPQVFRCSVLAQAFKWNEQDVTDEARLVELAGGRVKLFMGAYDNIKITTPADLAIARSLLRLRPKS